MGVWEFGIDVGLLGGLATFGWYRPKYGTGGKMLSAGYSTLLRSCVLYHVAVNSLHMLDEEPNKQMEYYNSCQPCLSRN